MQRFAFRADTSSYRLYRDTLCDEMFGVTAPSRPPDRIEIEGQMIMLDHGALVSLSNRGGEVVVERTARRIAAETAPAMWVFGICLEGSQIMTTPTGTNVTATGGMRLVDSQTAHVGITAAGTRLGMLSIPDSILRVACDIRGWSSRSLASSPIGRILASHLRSIFDELPQLESDDAQQVIPSVLPLLDAAMSGSRDALERARPSGRAIRRRQVLRFVEAHLSDPRLRPAWIAEALGLSPRYLHALFADQQRSIGETILARRLACCRDAILDPGNAALSITAIAFRFGFSSSSHFSRAFRREFGVAPSELRP